MSQCVKQTPKKKRRGSSSATSPLTVIGSDPKLNFLMQRHTRLWIAFLSVTMRSWSQPTRRSPGNHGIKTCVVSTVSGVSLSEAGAAAIRRSSVCVRHVQTIGRTLWRHVDRLWAGHSWYDNDALARLVWCPQAKASKGVGQHSGLAFRARLSWTRVDRRGVTTHEFRIRAECSHAGVCAHDDRDRQRHGRNDLLRNNSRKYHEGICRRIA